MDARWRGEVVLALQCLSWIAAVLVAVPAAAHVAGITQTDVLISGQQAWIVYTVPADSLEELLPTPDRGRGPVAPGQFVGDVLGAFTVHNGDRTCHLRPWRLEEPTVARTYRYTLVANCERPLIAFRLAYHLFVDDWPGHENFLYLRAGELRETHTLSRRRQTVEIHLEEPTVAEPAVGPGGLGAATPLATPPSRSFLGLGFRHIFGGLDHVLFILALLLATRGLGRLCLLITAFTVGHAVTLALSGLSLISVNPRFVESAIAFSLVFVALENLWQVRSGTGTERPKATHRIPLVFFFGLAHGLGFSEVLRDLGLSAQALVLPLLMFNLGIELGQLVIVMIAIPGLALAWRFVPRRKGVAVLSVVTALAGAFWFVERAFLGQLT